MLAPSTCWSACSPSLSLFVSRSLSLSCSGAGSLSCALGAQPVLRETCFVASPVDDVRDSRAQLPLMSVAVSFLLPCRGVLCTSTNQRAAFLLCLSLSLLPTPAVALFLSLIAFNRVAGCQRANVINFFKFDMRLLPVSRSRSNLCGLSLSLLRSASLSLPLSHSLVAVAVSAFGVWLTAFPRG